MLWNKIYSKIWADDWFTGLSTEERLLFIHLISNQKCNWSKVYEYPLREMSFYSGVDNHELIRMLGNFQSDDKVHYFNGYVVVVNAYRYQEYNTNNKKGCLNEIKALPESIKSYPAVMVLYDNWNKTIPEHSEPLAIITKATAPPKETKKAKDSEPDTELSSNGKQIKTQIDNMVKEAFESKGGLASNKRSTLSNANIESLISKYGFPKLSLMVRFYYEWKLPYTKQIKDDNLAIRKAWVEEKAEQHIDKYPDAAVPEKRQDTKEELQERRERWYQNTFKAYNESLVKAKIPPITMEKYKEQFKCKF